MVALKGSEYGNKMNLNDKGHSINLLTEICDKMHLTEALHFTYSAKRIEL
jgi:hypothetical protein